MTTITTPSDHITGLVTEMCGETIAVAANWADAASPVLYWGEGDWCHTGQQVADYSHSDQAALAEFLSDLISDSGDDPTEPRFADMIAKAVDRAVEIGHGES